MARRSFLERRDSLVILGHSYVSMATLASNPRFDIDASSEIVGDARMSFIKSAFPYFDFKQESKPKTYEDYSEYFDELDAFRCLCRARV